ncbi:MAG TPA: MobA-like NTP transferase domain containing protein [Gammaproteobacteria bacterium]|nr:MobA-like NTP transferase domain containing protein [Gammaproteobacteria bacterium]
MNDGAYTAIVLAADRDPDDPLVRSAGACCKALIEIGGTPMLERVVQALEQSRGVGDILVSGPARERWRGNAFLKDAVGSGRIRWLPPENSPSTSAYRAMEALPADRPVLLTTADHPLLSPAIVDHFLDAAGESGADVAVGLIRFEQIRQKFPRAHKTVTRFRDGGYCGCNLFAFLTPQSRQVAAAWRRVEQQRKNPLRIISQLGWWSVLRFLLGRLTLEQALARLSDRLGVRIRPVHMPFAEAAIDVDSIADQRLVEEITGSDN